MLRAIVLAVVNFLIGGQALAQELSIPLVTTPPTLADFVSMTPADDVRARYGYVSGFTQRTPQDGAPSSQRTDVYLGYDSRNLYAIFVAFDDDPASVRANLAPRENIENDDRVGLLIDTFDDQRTAYGFRSSPLGVQWDGRWSEVTRGGYDSSYEAVWYTDAQRTAGRLRRPHDDSVSHDAVSRDRRAALARAVRAAHSALERGVATGRRTRRASTAD